MSVSVTTALAWDVPSAVITPGESGDIVMFAGVVATHGLAARAGAAESEQPHATATTAVIFATWPKPSVRPPRRQHEQRSI